MNFEKNWTKQQLNFSSNTKNRRLWVPIVEFFFCLFRVFPSTSAILIAHNIFSVDDNEWERERSEDEKSSLDIVI